MKELISHFPFQTAYSSKKWVYKSAVGKDIRRVTGDDVRSVVMRMILSNVNSDIVEIG